MSEKDKIYRIPENKISPRIINIRKANCSVPLENEQINSSFKEKYKCNKIEIGEGCFGKV